MKISLNKVTEEKVTETDVRDQVAKVKVLKSKFEKSFIQIEKSIVKSFKENDPAILDEVTDRIKALSEAHSDYISEFL